jgi:hypothetical protein
MSSIKPLKDSIISNLRKIKDSFDRGDYRLTSIVLVKCRLKFEKYLNNIEEGREEDADESIKNLLLRLSSILSNIEICHVSEDKVQTAVESVKVPILEELSKLDGDSTNELRNNYLLSIKTITSSSLGKDMKRLLEISEKEDPEFSIKLLLKWKLKILGEYINAKIMMPLPSIDMFYINVYRILLNVSQEPIGALLLEGGRINPDSSLESDHDAINKIRGDLKEFIGSIDTNNMEESLRKVFLLGSRILKNALEDDNLSKVVAGLSELSFNIMGYNSKELSKKYSYMKSKLRVLVDKKEFNLLPEFDQRVAKALLSILEEKKYVELSRMISKFTKEVVSLMRGVVVKKKVTECRVTEKIVAPEPVKKVESVTPLRSDNGGEDTSDSDLYKGIIQKVSDHISYYKSIDKCSANLPEFGLASIKLYHSVKVVADLVSDKLFRYDLHRLGNVISELRETSDLKKLSKYMEDLEILLGTIKNGSHISPMTNVGMYEGDRIDDDLVKLQDLLTLRMHDHGGSSKYLEFLGIQKVITKVMMEYLHPDEIKDIMERSLLPKFPTMI